MSDDIDSLVMSALQKMLRLVDLDVELSERVCAAQSEVDFLDLIQQQDAVRVELESARDEYQRLRKIQKDIDL